MNQKPFGKSVEDGLIPIQSHELEINVRPTLDGFRNVISKVHLKLDARSIIGRRIPATFVVFVVILFEFAVR
jgi:hypothetical protein